MEKEPLRVIAGSPDKPLVIGEIEIPCYVLEGETRVLAQRGLVSSMGISWASSIEVEGGARMPRFAASKSLQPHITAETRAGLTNPILFSYEGNIAYGYPATLLPDLCDAYLAARADGDLQPQQKHIAERCELLMRGFARGGIIALVDEATGYEAVRGNLTLAKIVEKFIAPELQLWTKTFSDEFYSEICRLNGWGDFNRSTNCPSVVGCYTNDIVYDRLAPGVLKELQSRNPVTINGHRRFRHHQYLTPDHGHPKLREHLIGVIALMRSYNDWDDFKRGLSRSFPKPDEQIAMAMGKEGEIES